MPEDSRSPLQPDQPRDEDILNGSAAESGQGAGSRREPGSGSPLPSDVPGPEDALRPGGGPAAGDSDHAEPGEQSASGNEGEAD